jgi:hypothetical protein
MNVCLLVLLALLGVGWTSLLTVKTPSGLGWPVPSGEPREDAEKQPRGVATPIRWGWVTVPYFEEGRRRVASSAASGSGRLQLAPSRGHGPGTVVGEEHDSRSHANERLDPPPPLTSTVPGSGRHTARYRTCPRRDGWRARCAATTFATGYS